MAFKQVYNPYFDQDKEVKTFSFNAKKLTALYLYREHDQEIGFKENFSLKPLVFTWKKPIYTCFNMVNVPYDLGLDNQARFFKTPHWSIVHKPSQVPLKSDSCSISFCCLAE